jgi:hypothetical protein
MYAERHTQRQEKAQQVPWHKQALSVLFLYTVVPPEPGITLVTAPQLQQRILWSQKPAIIITGSHTAGTPPLVGPNGPSPLV